MIKEPHESHERHNVSCLAIVVKVGVILGQIVGRTFLVLFPFIRENLIGDAHLDVICLAGEEEQRLVLRLPTETSDCSVVAGRVHMPRNAEEAFQTHRVRDEIVLDGGVRDALNQAATEHGCRYAKDQVARIGEVGLANFATWRIVRTPDSCEDRVNSSIEGPIRSAYESHLPDRSVDIEKRWNRAARSHRGGAHNLRVIRRRAGSSERGEYVTSTARIEIEPRPQALLHVFHFRKLLDADVIEEGQITRRQPRTKRRASSWRAASYPRVYLRVTARGQYPQQHHRKTQAYSPIAARTSYSILETVTHGDSFQFVYRGERTGCLQICRQLAAHNSPMNSPAFVVAGSIAHLLFQGKCGAKLPETQEWRGFRQQQLCG